MSRFIIGSRAEALAALRAQEAALAAAEEAARYAALTTFSAQLAALRRVLDDAVSRIVGLELAAPADAEQQTRPLRAAFAAQADARRRELHEAHAALGLAAQLRAEQRREIAEELFLDALFIAAQFPGGQIAEAGKCAYARDVRACAGLCRATWAEEAFWSGIVRVRAGPGKRTRLMYAAAQGDAARVAWLLARGAPREAQDADGQTALHWACRNSHMTAMRALLAAGADIDAAQESGRSPLWVAAHEGRTDVVRALLAEGAYVDAAEGGTPPLYTAAFAGHIDVMRVLLAGGAAVNARALDGSSALHAATHAGNACVRVLCAAGADVDARNTLGETPLIRAVKRGRSIDTVRVLLSLGADVEAADHDGWRPLHFAASDGRVRLAALLLVTGDGADRNALTNAGESPSDLTMSEAMEILLDEDNDSDADFSDEED